MSPEYLNNTAIGRNDVAMANVFLQIHGMEIDIWTAYEAERNNG